VAGKSSISTVGLGYGLNYRGYSINELAEKSSFEEVAYLLLIGKLPTAFELNEFKGKIKAKRKVNQVLKRILEKIPKEAHPMDVMRCICSFLGVLEGESKENN
jgi:2-methylcitrate synthase